LKKLDFLSREQLQTIHRLGQKRNANRILTNLSPYLSKFREDYTTVYYLNAKGREAVDSERVRKRNATVNHVLMRNDFYIHSGFPSHWRNELALSDGTVKVIMDAWFKSEGYYNILEVDYMQTMKENRAKIERYRQLFHNGAVADKYGYFPCINWLTTSEVRRKQLQEACSDLPCMVYTIEDIK
jgi:hypothetical protein